MTTRAQARPDRLYFVNPVVDILLIGGLSLAALALIKYRPDALHLQRFSLVGVLLILVNWPHFSATSFRLYHRNKNIAQYPMTAGMAPLVAIGGIAASLAFPMQIAPIFIKLFLLWSSYHFSGQTVGISLLYARRGGMTISRLQRTLLSGFVFSTFLWPMAAFESNLAGNSYFGVNYPGLGIPFWVADWIHDGMLACGALLLLTLIVATWRTRKLPPLIFFLPAATQYAWFVGGAGLSGFTELVPAFHSLQYMLIAWAMHLGESLQEGRSRPGPAFVFSESARWYGINIVGGLILFYVLPKAVAHMGVSEGLAEGVLLAGIQIHHFFVDGVVWKLKSSAVSSPLRGTLGDLLGPPPEIALPGVALAGGQR